MAAMMSAGDVHSVLDALEAEGVAVWLDGGWGVDALLGYQSRPHDDLDIALSRDDRAHAEQALSALGFTHDVSAEPGLPARLVLRNQRGQQIDVHPLVFDRRGDAWQDLGEDGWGGYPADGLTGVGYVEGRRVQCLTPELQVRHHLGYEWNDTDRHDLEHLVDRFQLDRPVGL